MHLPDDPKDVPALISQSLRSAEASRANRKDLYDVLRQWYLFGTDAPSPARFNKIYSAISRKSSFLYARGATRLAVECHDCQHLNEAASLKLTRAWRTSGADAVFSQATEWASVYGSAIVKLTLSSGAPRARLVLPQNFSVGDESREDLEEQDFMVERFEATRDQLLRIIASYGGSPKLLDRITFRERESPESTRSRVLMLGQLSINAPSGPSPSSVSLAGGPWGDVSLDYTPNNSEPVAACAEMWLWDDDRLDYLVILYAEPDVIIASRYAEKVFVKADHPYHLVRVKPLPAYIWGQSDVARILTLQQWRSLRMEQLDALFAQQLRPPTATTGVTGITDEKIAAMWRPGGSLNLNVPTAKLEVFRPTLPDAPFAEIAELDAMFSEAIELPPVLAGEAPGKGGSVAEQASLALGPILRASLEVERTVSAAAQTLFSLLAVYDAEILMDESNSPFILKQLPEDAEVSVLSHSSSPLFREALEQKAQILLREGIIDGPTYVELTDPPQAETLIRRLKQRLAAAEQEKQGMVAAAAETLASTPAPQRGNVAARLIRALTGNKR